MLTFGSETVESISVLSILSTLVCIARSPNFFVNPSDLVQSQGAQHGK